MSSEFWIIQTFNGLSYGALLFLLASGLSLIFGVMRVVNLAHGSYFMLGGYVGLSVVWRTGSFAAAVLAGAVAIGLIGIGMERLFLRRLPGQTLGQVLMTIGFALIFQDLALLIWGGDPYSIPVPRFLQGAVKAGALSFPAYRIFIIVVAVVVAALLWLALDQTRAGARIRAAVDDGDADQDAGPAHHARPKRPVGRSARMSAIGANSVKYESSGKSALPKLSSSPTRRLPTIAPGRLPRPPTMTTTNA